jgi:tungstate transport system substrate-binding protein
MRLKMKQFLKKIKYILFINLVLVSQVNSEQEFITLQATTSTRDSGIYNYIFPDFELKHNIQVRVIAVGTGQALNNIKNCDGDVAITHSKDLEFKYLNENYIISRTEFMYNDFIFIGPKTDPAKIAGSKNPLDVLKKIYKSKTKFSSRGDNSGTHMSELNLWRLAGLFPSKYKDTWYLDVGSGMGATINIAIGVNGYTYSDRATWLNFKNKEHHVELFSGHKLLFNQYSILIPNSKLCNNVKANLSSIFKNWLLSESTKALIRSYKIDEQQLFFIN